MEVFKIALDLKLRNNLHYRDSIELLSRNVNKIIFNSLLLRTLHESQTFKPYVLGSMGKTEADRMYHENKTYTLHLHSIDQGFCEEFIKAAKIAKVEFDILDVRYEPMKIGRIEKVYTLTPAVLTVRRNHYWTIEDDLMLLVERVKENLLKKYRYLFKKEITPPKDFIRYFRILNHKPIIFNYKRGKIFANRFEFVFTEEEASQQLAKLAFGAGILEKNPLGFGMVARSNNGS